MLSAITTARDRRAPVAAPPGWVSRRSPPAHPCSWVPTRSPTTTMPVAMPTRACSATPSCGCSLPTASTRRGLRERPVRRRPRAPVDSRSRPAHHHPSTGRRDRQAIDDLSAAVRGRPQRSRADPPGRAASTKRSSRPGRRRPPSVGVVPPRPLSKQTARLRHFWWIERPACRPKVVRDKTLL